MSTIPIQNLIIDNDTDIGLSSDLVNGTYKTSSLTDLSKNVYSKISDLSSNVYSTLSTKESILNFSNPLLRTSNNISIDLSAYPQKTYVDGSLNTINNTLLNKQNLITVVTPLKKDVSNNITIDLSAYPLKINVDSSLNSLNTNKQNVFTCITPLIKNDVSNNISIDLSAYDTIALRNTALSSYLLSSTASSTYATISNVNTKENILSFTSPLIRTSNNITIDLSAYDTIALRNTALSSYLLSSTASSTYATISNLNTKQNIISVSTPLNKDISNNITIDLSAYPLKTYVDGSLNTINTTLGNKQNIITVSTPLIKDISNNITIDLSAYPLKTYVDGSLNTINTTLGTKQNNLTFSNPFLNTSNTISLKYNSAQFNIDSSGNLSLVSSTSSQWTTTGTKIYYNSGNVGIGTTNPYTLLHVKGTNPSLTIMGQGNTGATSQLNLSTYDTTTNAPNCSLIATDTGSFGATFQIKQKTVGADANAQFTSFFIKQDGNIGIGTINPNYKLHIRGGNPTTLRIETDTSAPNQVSGIELGIPAFPTAGSAKITSTARSGDIADLQFSTSSGTNNSSVKMTIMGNGNVGIGTINPLCKLQVNGIVNITNGNQVAVRDNYMTGGSLTIGDTGLSYGTATGWSTNTAGLMMECADNTEIVVHDSGNRLASLIYFEGGGTNKITLGRDKGWNAISLVDIKSGLNIIGEFKNQYWKMTNQSDYLRLYNNAGTAYFNLAAAQLYADTTLQVNSTANINGVLTMGSSIKFKTDVWNYSTENYQRIYYANAWTSYYQGYGNANDFSINHEFRNHAGDARFVIYNGVTGGARVYGQFTCKLYTTNNQHPHDYVGVPYETAANSSGDYTLQLILNSFTGFHRCFTEDELFDENEPQLFKNTYEGRIVISSGKIGTQIGNEKDGYDIKYDKEGIFIEDSHPIVQLSRNKKDKRVFGVLGMKNRKNSNEKRLIVNSIGEGGIWVCNSNGIIENGDYITSSDYLGYGEKQDDDLLHNYTVAKATMDCNFELDSNLYNCLELENGFRIAFIACTYHCG